MSRGRDRFRRFIPVLRAAETVLDLLPASVSRGLLVALRDVPGHLGLGLRYVLIRRLAVSCGDNVAVYAGVHLHDLDRCRLGSNIKIGEMCFVGASGGLTIEDDVSIAHGCSILTEEHDHTQPGPLRETPLVFRPVIIRTGVWIGAGVRVLSGTEVGTGSAVGAGSVVTRDVPPFSIVAGVPATVIKHRRT